jgi:hypothetical protein
MLPVVITRPGTTLQCPDEGKDARPATEKVVDVATVAALRARGIAWREISSQLGVGVATLYRVAQGRSKNLFLNFGTP